MTATFQIGETLIPVDELPSLLNRYQLTPQLVRQVIVEQALANFPCTEAEEAAAIAGFWQQYQLTTPEAQATWLQAQGMTPEDLKDLATRPLRLEKFKAATWNSKVQSYFLANKVKFDRVIYSLLRTKDLGVVQEAYFRIQEGEQTFSDLAQQHSQGPEANTGGIVGPVTLSTPHPVISRILSVSQPGQLWPPTRVEDWFVIVRLEKFFPAQLDEPVRRHILNELFEAWLQEQVQQVGPLRLRSSRLAASP